MIGIAILVVVNDRRVIAKRKLSSIFQNINFFGESHEKIKSIKRKGYDF